jgi:hypothetical protein
MNRPSARAEAKGDTEDAIGESMSMPTSNRMAEVSLPVPPHASSAGSGVMRRGAAACGGVGIGASGPGGRGNLPHRERVASARASQPDAAPVR